jgi:AraC-like DNA-binding protein
MANRSVSVHFARAVLKHTVRQGLDPVGLLRKNRISPRLLLEDDARISAERFADLQVSTMLAMEDEILGYATRKMPIGSWSMMCHAVIGSSNLGQALSRYCRFYQLFDFDPDPLLEEDGNTTSLRLRQSGSTMNGGFGCELFLSNAYRFLNWLGRAQLPLLGVDLASPPTARRLEYQQVFGNSPVRFEQAQTCLQLSSSVLEQPLRQNETSLRRFLRHPVLFMLTREYADQSWATQVRDILRQSMEQAPELSEVAAALDLHPQTLRRRLAAEGTSFKDIRSRLRRDTALHFLGKQGLSIEEIAHRAGFSESSAFIRAFKNWTGVTPYSYRKGL